MIQVGAVFHALQPFRVVRGERVKARGLLGGDEVDDHVDDAGAARAAAQVHARAPDLVLQQLVQLPAQLLHQLGHLGNTHIDKQSLSVF